MRWKQECCSESGGSTLRSYSPGLQRVRGHRWQRHHLLPHPRLRLTFIFLQLPDVTQHRLQIHVETVAVAQELQEVSGAHGAPRVVDELPGGGQAIWQNLKFLTLWSKSMNQIWEEKSLICQGPLHCLFSEENYRLRNKRRKLHSKFTKRQIVFPFKNVIGQSLLKIQEVSSQGLLVNTDWV